MTDQPLTPRTQEESDLLKKIQKSLNELVSLRIITAVGPVSVSGTDGEISLSFEDAKAMYTEINLLQGDIKTMYDDEFVVGNYQSLRAFHQSREKDGQKIIQDNIQALFALLRLLQGRSTQETLPR